MKRFLFTLPLLFIVVSPLLSQDAKDIMKKAYEACQSIREGYYEMTEYSKNMTEHDTVQRSFKCHFRKLDDDTLYHTAFHYEFFFEGKHTSDVLYTGDALVHTDVGDSTAKIMTKEKWAGDIKKYSHNQTFYTPFTHRKSMPLPGEGDFTDDRHTFTYLGEVVLNNVPCHHIQIDEKPKPKSGGMIKVTGIKYQYWVSKTDFVPVQYSEALDLIMNKQAMHQYYRFHITRYELNNLKDDQALTMNSIPSYYRVMDYVPYEAPELLPADTLAPSWRLPSLDDKNIELSALRGKVVLIDFFYKSCAPCIQALPVLQRLHEDYGKKGLTVIGIDPYDKKEDIMEFLAKRGVTYPILLDGNGVAKAYNVSAYPTVYLIGRDGKVIEAHVGYGEGMEEELRKVITKHL